MRGSRVKWKADVEAAASPLGLADTDGSAMDFDRPLGDGETEAGAASFARAALVDAIEAIEDARLLVLGNSGALIGDGNFCYLLRFAFHFDQDLALRGRVFDRIIHEIEDGLAQDAAIGADGDLHTACRSNQLMLVFGQDADHADDFLDQVHARKSGELQCYLAAVGAGDHQQAVDQVSKTPDFFQHAGDDFAVRLTGVNVLQTDLAYAAQ